MLGSYYLWNGVVHFFREGGIQLAEWFVVANRMFHFGRGLLAVDGLSMWHGLARGVLLTTEIGRDQRVYVMELDREGPEALICNLAPGFLLTGRNRASESIR